MFSRYGDLRGTDRKPALMRRPQSFATLRMTRLQCSELLGGAPILSELHARAEAELAEEIDNK